MSDVVIDASVILALLQEEAISEDVIRLSVGSVLSVVNFAELVAVAERKSLAFEKLNDVIDKGGIRVEPVTYPVGLLAGRLNARYRSMGLSLADSFCVAEGQSRNCPILTADRIWATLDIGADIVLIR